MNHIQRIERLEGIPTNLLAAMAHVESGRYNKDKKLVEPWPWTVQSQGKSNYFNTRDEAVEYVKGLQRRGIKNIDIGCMQMNVEHHGHKFASIEDMFEPAHNVGQGAKYLKQLKTDQNRAWSTAVGNYHSFTPEHHMRYKNLVLKKFSQVNRGGGNTFADHNALHGGIVPGISAPAPITRHGVTIYKGSGGSLYPGASKKSNKPVSASLFSYSRAGGIKGTRKPEKVSKPKVISLSAQKRTAMMVSHGVQDLAFMDKKGRAK